MKKEIEIPLLYIEFSLDFEKYITQELYVVLMLWILEGPKYTIDWIQLKKILLKNQSESKNKKNPFF